MTKFNTFEELKQARLIAYKGMVEGDVLGYLDQHTGFYPDPTHFIYELLQNAEDMEATEVTFRLYNDKLIFEHNGVKRDFDLNDIDAITNKGKSPKADDPTQIGKFGMGFKAVYVYTSTPEIHSGIYDFRIENVIVPNDENVPKLAREKFTQFIFPFDNRQKEVEKIVKEIYEDGLEKLNETALIFLSHIKKIVYYLPDGKKGCVGINTGINGIDFLSVITVDRPDSNKEISYWARFSDYCDILFRDNETQNKTLKNFPVSIAYRLNESEGGVFFIDSSLEGKVCLFFPTVINSLLHFHINAPFASTVARDVILDKGEEGKNNNELLKKLASLTASSLHRLRDKKLLDYEAYAALPTLKDFENQPQSRYKIFAECVKSEFEKENLFITEGGDYQSINDVWNASILMKKILPQEFVKRIYGKSWIPTVRVTTRVELFIDQFKINNYTIEDFIDRLQKDSSAFDELFSENKNNEYFDNLYYMLFQSDSREYSSTFFDKKTPRKDILRPVKLLLCEDGELHNAKESVFLRTEYTPKHYLKNPLYVNISKKHTKHYENIKNLLLSIGVKEMCASEDLTADLSDGGSSFDDYQIKMLEIIDEYNSGKITISDFVDTELFIAENIGINILEKSDKPIQIVKASDCCWSKSASFFYQKTKFIISQKKYAFLNPDEYLSLYKIFSALGGKTEPKIVKTFLGDNYPLFNLLKTEGERYNTCKRDDYTIDEFDWRLLNTDGKNLEKESALLWRMVLKCNNSQFFYAEYRPNKSSPPQYLESSLVYYLKRISWVPTQSGIYKRPYELEEGDLLDEFAYEKPSALLIAISEKPNDTFEELKSKGIEDENILKFASLSPEDQSMLIEIGEKLFLQKQAKGKSLTEMIASSDRGQSSINDEDDDFEYQSDSKNLERRKIKLEKEFDEREEPETHSKYVHFVLRKPNMEEKIFVQNQYHSHCQICNREGIITAKGKRYCEAINIFDTKQLKDSSQVCLDLGWNTLCLCPTCAAKFKYSQLTISGLFDYVKDNDIVDIKKPYVDIPIKLEEKDEVLHFTVKHLLALKTAIEKISEKEN